MPAAPRAASAWLFNHSLARSPLHCLAVEHLKTRADFQAVMAAGIATKTSHFALHRAQAGTNGICRIGAVIPKRWAKKAVTRNAIRRQIYVAMAQWAPQLPVASHVVRLRASFDSEQFNSATSDALKRALQTELQQLFEKLPRP